MNPTTHPTKTSALLEGPSEAKGPADSTVAAVANEFGVSPFRQMKEIFSMRYGTQKLGANEYYDLRVFDPVHDKKAKHAFLGQDGINTLNLRMNPDHLMEQKNIVGHKLMYTDQLLQARIPTTHTQAMVLAGYTKDPAFVLSDVEAITTFFEQRAKFPVFGKPMGGSLSVGSVRIVGIADGQLTLGNGATVPLADFAADVIAQYKDGYLLQTALQPHVTMQAITGQTIGSVRIVTVNDGTGVAPAYAVWKIHSPTAMSDNFWQDGSMLSLIDIKDGKVVSCHRGKGPSAELHQDHPASKQPIVGFTVPFWQEAVQSAISAHELFPDFGICGFDIAITDKGPVVLECNDQPNHMIYQFAARRGVQNRDLQPIWASVIAQQKVAA